jgi:hypothetical protein
MKSKHYYYDFTLWPRRWKAPDSSWIEEDDHYETLKWRNKLSNFVKHWLDLSYSWRLVGRWLIPGGLLIYSVTQSIIASATVVAFSLLTEIISKRKIEYFRKVTLLVEGLIDPTLEEHYGPLPPLTQKYDE